MSTCSRRPTHRRLRRPFAVDRQRIDRRRHLGASRARPPS
ncbi:MAG: DUF3678 domain-containing protein [Chloroflexi bacterium]|nr:MAG: DUF3678 domain-containing protein [Chloroflexota bacterium]